MASLSHIFSAEATSSLDLLETLNHFFQKYLAREFALSAGIDTFHQLTSSFMYSITLLLAIFLSAAEATLSFIFFSDFLHQSIRLTLAQLEAIFESINSCSVCILVL